MPKLMGLKKLGMKFLLCLLTIAPGVKSMGPAAMRVKGMVKLCYGLMSALH